MTVKPGNVPTDQLGPLLGDFILDRWPFGGGVMVLAEKVGCDPSGIEGIIAQENSGVSFDLADALFCALGRPDVWRGQLADVYFAHELMETCSHPDCSACFPPKRHGGRPRLYCTRACANSHAANNRRIKHFRGKAQRGKHSSKCRNGHRRTPENTITLKSGRIRCRICNNATSNASYARVGKAHRRQLAAA